MTFIAVGHARSTDGSIDLHVRRAGGRARSARRSRGKAGYHVVVVKSTVVPGTTDGVVPPVLEQASGKRAGRRLRLGMNPEFLTEGEAVDDFMNPDRIVIGGIDRTHAARSASCTPASPGVPRSSDQHRHRGDDQVRVERAARDRDLVLERDRQLCAAIGGVDIVE